MAREAKQAASHSGKKRKRKELKKEKEGKNPKNKHINLNARAISGPPPRSAEINTSKTQSYSPPLPKPRRDSPSLRLPPVASPLSPPLAAVLLDRRRRPAASPPTPLPPSSRCVRFWLRSFWLGFVFFFPPLVPPLPKLPFFLRVLHPLERGASVFRFV